MKFAAATINNVIGSLGLGAQDMARVLCVDECTVYRWKAAADSIVGSGPGPTVAVDGFAGRVLDRIEATQHRLGGELGNRIRVAMVVGGSLAGTRVLLEAIT